MAWLRNRASESRYSPSSVLTVNSCFDFSRALSSSETAWVWQKGLVLDAARNHPSEKQLKGCMDEQGGMMRRSAASTESMQEISSTSLKI